MVRVPHSDAIYHVLSVVLAARNREDIGLNQPHWMILGGISGSMSKKLRKKPSYLLIIGLLLFVALILWNFRTNLIFAQYYLEVASQGVVEHHQTVEVIFANTETILTAPIQGKATLPQEEGRRVAKGEIIARIVPTGIDHGTSGEEVILNAPNSGLFYSRYDNLEQIITPENLMNMDLEGLLSQTTAESSPIDHDVPISKYSPLGKIVNNLYPTWMFVYLDKNDKMHKGDTVRITVDDYEYTGVVMKSVQQPKGAIVRFSQYVRGSTENRIRKATWIVKPPTRGLVVPSSALSTRGEEIGIYIAEEGMTRFRPVRILDDNGVLACVQGVREGEKVVVNPKKEF